MVQGFMAKQIMAVAWVILLNQIRYKAAEAGAWAGGRESPGYDQAMLGVRGGCSQDVRRASAFVSPVRTDDGP
jgi:hypothetical protein